MKLQQKVFINILWSKLNFLCMAGLQVTITLVLAKTLSPADFGLIAIMSIFLVLSNQFIDFGLKTALIRQKSVTDLTFSTVFFTNIFLGIFSCIILIIAAPFIAEFYQEPRLIDLVRLASFAVIFNSSQLVPTAILHRTLNFKILFIANLSSVLISAIFTILLALNNFGVWALIVQMLSFSISLSILLFLLSTWRPKIIFSWKIISEFFGFSYKVFLGDAINTIFSKSYLFIIGKLFTINTVGLYFFAERLKDFLMMGLVSAFQSVTYPVLSSKSGNLIEFKISYQKLTKTIALVTFPFFFTILFFLELVLNFLLPGKWNEAISYFKLLILSTLFLPFSSINLNILLALGRSDLFLFVEIIKKTLLICLLFFSSFYGIYAIIYGQIVLSLLSFFINSHYSKSLINYSIFNQLKDIIPYFLISTSVFTIFYFLQLYLAWHPLLKFLILSIFGIILYICITFLLKLEALNILRSLIYDYFKTKNMNSYLFNKK